VVSSEVTVLRLDIAYDGAGFRGYARQTGLRTVQRELEDALGTILRADVVTSVAGRTDAGVHARHQVVSFQHDEVADLDRMARSLQGLMGPEIAVLGLTTAPDDFSARFSATWRRYRYRIDARPARDPLTRGFVWHVGRPLDLAAMRAAAAVFVGEHDFSSFCRAVEGKSNVRRVAELSVEESDGLIDIWAQANAFCHQMVRSLVGYLFDVGRGFSDGALAEEVLAAGDRSAVATVAPAHGLTLWEVGYE
jgi:tRNA pseudouridine38-40 synthase